MGCGVEAVSGSQLSQWIFFFLSHSFLETLHLMLASPEMLLFRILACAENIELCYIPLTPGMEFEVISL